MTKSFPLLLVSTALFSACNADDGRPEYPHYDTTILDLAKADSTLSTFVELATIAKLDKLLGGTQAVVTVFAPTNAAFSAVPAADLEALKADPAALSAVLRFHMVGGKQKANLVVLAKDILTITSTTIHVSGEADFLVLSDYLGSEARVGKKDLEASNGLLFTIDKLLSPPPPPPPGDLLTELDLAGFTTLVEAITTAGLDVTLADVGPFTVLAPNEDAFAAVDLSLVDAGVLANILLNHVLSGEIDSETLAAGTEELSAAGIPLAIEAGPPVTIGGAELGALIDIPAANGVAHEVLSVIVPPTAVEYVDATAELSTLSAAVAKAETELAGALAPDTLMGDMPITVFAPDDAAFSAAGIVVANTSSATIATVLGGHVVSGQFLIADLEDGQILTTQNGTVAVSINGLQVSIVDGHGNTANLVGSEARTLSGVVHVIDQVLE